MSRLTAKRAAKNSAAEARQAKDFAMEYVVPHLTTARDAVVPALEHARGAVAPVLGQAREAAAPHLTVARDKAMILKDEVLPKVAAGVSAGLAASEPVRTEALRRGTGVVAALRGQIEPPKQHRGRKRVGKALVVVTLAAGASAAYKAWKLPHASDDWVHTDASADGTIPATTNPADALAEELRARNGQVPDPVAH